VPSADASNGCRCAPDKNRLIRINDEMSTDTSDARLTNAVCCSHLIRLCHRSHGVEPFRLGRCGEGEPVLGFTAGRRRRRRLVVLLGSSSACAPTGERIVMFTSVDISQVTAFTRKVRRTIWTRTNRKQTSIGCADTCRGVDTRTGQRRAKTDDARQRVRRRASFNR
jgi:hypothetical protein